MEQKREASTQSYSRFYPIFVTQIYERSNIGMIATIVNAVILTIVLWSHIQHWILIIWLSLIEIITVLRFILNRLFLHRANKSTDIHRWGLLLIIGIGIAGILWGSSAILLYPEHSNEHQVIIAFILAGMVAGGVGVFSPLISVFLAFSVPALLPIIYRFIIAGDNTHFAMGIMIFLFAILTFVTARNINRSNFELIKLKETFADQLKDRTNELSYANQELEAFSYSVAHDLRNPLISIKAMADILKSDYKSTIDDDGLNFISAIQKNTLNMMDIISDLLQLSLLSRQPLRFENINIGSIAFEIAAALKRSDTVRNSKIIIQEGMFVLGDKNLIKLALDNLIQNAWKYSSRNACTIIEIGSLVKSGKTIFYVKDNGIGFDMINAKRIFAPFQRAHTDKEFKGTGIGLSIVKRIIEKHGGEIWVEAKIGEGACFYFTLPG
jgi:signal transduction histidine kinase